eukprot:1157786-Pelagomonas_calceolata.AAC.4
MESVCMRGPVIARGLAKGRRMGALKASLFTHIILSPHLRHMHQSSPASAHASSVLTCVTSCILSPHLRHLMHQSSPASPHTSSVFTC